jgi:hypothetical protein
MGSIYLMQPTQDGYYPPSPCDGRRVAAGITDVLPHPLQTLPVTINKQMYLKMLASP